MSAIVIDTNVLLVASGQAAQMSDACRIECLKRLAKARNEQVVVDNQFLILKEYQNKLDTNRRPPSPGGEFVRYILQNMSNFSKVSTVDLTAKNAERTLFVEFPIDPELEDQFDPADRKFVAAAYAHPEKPPIVESADSKWLGWEPLLTKHGLCLEVLCRGELQAIRDQKLAKKSK